MSEEANFLLFIERNKAHNYSANDLDAYRYYATKTRSLDALIVYIRKLWNCEGAAQNETLQYLLYDCVCSIFYLKIEISEPFITVDTFMNLWMCEIETSIILRETPLSLSQLSIIAAISRVIDERFLELVKNNVILFKRANALQKKLKDYYQMGAILHWKHNPTWVSFLISTKFQLSLDDGIYSYIPQVSVAKHCLDDLIIPFFSAKDPSLDRKDLLIQNNLSRMVQFIEKFLLEKCDNNAKTVFMNTLIDKLIFTRKGTEKDYVLSLVILLNSAYLEEYNDLIIRKVFVNYDHVLKLGVFLQFTELFKRCSYNIHDLHLVESLTLGTPAKGNDTNELFLLNYLVYTKPSDQYISLLEPYCTSASLSNDKRELAHLAMVNVIGENKVEIENYLRVVVLEKEQYRYLSEDQVLMIFEKELPKLNSARHLSPTVEEKLTTVSVNDPSSLCKLTKCSILTLIRSIHVEDLDNDEIVESLNRILSHIGRYPERHILLSYMWKELISNKENWYDNDCGIKWWYKNVLTSKL